MDKIEKILRVTEAQAEENVRDFLEAMESMGIILVDEDDSLPSADFVVEQYLAIFS